MMDQKMIYLYICLPRDTLQVSEIETEIITQDDLDELRTFILGDSELESRQLTLWPIYSFDIIPIQLISIPFR